MKVQDQKCISASKDSIRTLAAEEMIKRMIEINSVPVVQVMPVC